MKSPQNKPFLQLAGKLHQQKNKRLDKSDKHDGNHISRPHKRPFSWLKVSDPFRTHPKTALGRGTRRWAAFTVLPGTAMERVNRLCSACDPWPCATTGFLRNSGSSWVNFTSWAFGCELLPNNPMCLIKVIPSLKANLITSWSISLKSLCRG